VLCLAAPSVQLMQPRPLSLYLLIVYGGAMKVLRLGICLLVVFINGSGSRTVLLSERNERKPLWRLDACPLTVQ